MSDVQFKRNPANGKHGFAWDDEDVPDVVFADSEVHAVMACLVIARGKWWADNDGTLGSQLDEVKTINARTRSDVEAYCREALSGLVKAQRITVQKILVELPAQGQAGRVAVAVYWATRGGREEMRKVYF